MLAFCCMCDVSERCFVADIVGWCSPPVNKINVKQLLFSHITV